MKIFPLNIIKSIKNKTENIGPVLFYGNEGSLISGLIKSFYNSLQKKIELSETKYFDYKNNKEESLIEILSSPTLFAKKNFVVIRNPNEKTLIDLKKIKIIKDIVIINGENLNNKSKLRSFFDNHKDFISVPCYKLDKNNIKIIIDEFISIHNVKLQNDAYWFLIDNITEDFLSIKNELQKLLCFKSSAAKISDLKNLIVEKNHINSDNYFFNCATGNAYLVLKENNSSNKSISESNEILLSLKKLIFVLSQAVIDKGNKSIEDIVNIHLPKHLFMKKEVFGDILRKTNLKKIVKINKMLQRVEYLQRKNSEQHKEVLERFLLNLTKTIN